MRWILLLALSVAAWARPLGGRQVAVWKPTGPGPHPVVLFSHGYRGMNVQSYSLMKALAAGGYLVLAPNHRDASGQLHPLKVSFERPETWNEKSQRSRGEDLYATYKAALADPELGPLMNRDEVALVGHSLGGYTALALGGAWPSWAHADLKPRAVVAWSPYVAPLALNFVVKNVRLPIMYQGGTLDRGLTPVIVRPGGAWDQTTSPKVFVDIEGARHISWSEWDTSKAALMGRYTVAFLNHFVKGEAADPILHKAPPGVAELRSHL